MEKLIIKYLNRHYKLSFKSNFNHEIYGKIEKKDVSFPFVMNELTTIFSVEMNEAEKMVYKWSSNLIVLMNNRVVSLQESLYKEGYDSNLTSTYIKRILNE